MHRTLVTGGAKRLGAAICRKLAENGHSLLIHYHTSEKEAVNLAIECSQYGVKAEIIQGDFTSFETTRQFIMHCQNQYPHVKNIVNNVGNYLVASPTETNPEQWNALFQVNLHAPFALIHGYIESIKAAKGTIINIGTAGINTLRANPRQTAYVATKSGLFLLTKSLAAELASYGVRVHMVSPGQLDISVDQISPEKIPMGRLGTAQETAHLIAYLMGPSTEYMTGQNIEIAGGYTL